MIFKPMESKTAADKIDCLSMESRTGLDMIIRLKSFYI